MLALLPVDTLLAELPRIAVDAADARRLRDGRAIGPVEGAPECCRAYAPDGTLLGVVAREGDMLTPQRMARSTVLTAADAAAIRQLAGASRCAGE